MKKVVVIFLTAVFILCALFIILHKTPLPIHHYYIKNKDFGQGGNIRSWIQADDPAIIALAEQLKSNNELQSIINAYDYLEKNYHYVQDSHVSFSDGTITLKNYGDYWQKPLLTLSIIEQTGGFYGDCEDGSLFLTSLLNAMGYKSVYCEIGTITLDSGIYGHAWVVYVKNNTPYLLETTLGREITKLSVLPSYYSPQLMFNKWEVKEFYAKGKNDYPMLTIKARNELIKRMESEHE